MQNEILYSPAYAMARITLNPGESVNVEGGSMVGMSANMKIKTTLGGTKRGIFGRFLAFWGALIRKIFGGETMFLNNYTPEGGAGEVLVSPSLTGQIIHHPMQEGRMLYIQSSSYLASSPDIRIRTKWGGFRSLFGGEGLALLKASGEGDLWINAYGDIEEIDVDGEYVVDTGHVVAFDESLKWKIGRVGGMKSLFFSGEGLVSRFSGKGKLYIQTHNLGAIVKFLAPLLP